MQMNKMKLSQTIVQKLKSPNVREGAAAITIWSFPWVIVACVIVFFKDQVGILHEVEYARLTAVIGFFYAVSSFCSFKGFILPLFKDKDFSVLEKIGVPKTKGEIFAQGKALLLKHKHHDFDASLYSDIVVIHDFLCGLQEDYSDSTLFTYIPTVDQMRAYPYESLELMLSAQALISEKYDTKYFNFDLIIETCLSGKKVI